MRPLRDPRGRQEVQEALGEEELGSRAGPVAGKFRYLGTPVWASQGVPWVSKGQDVRATHTKSCCFRRRWSPPRANREDAVRPTADFRPPLVPGERHTGRGHVCLTILNSPVVLKMRLRICHQLREIA